MIVAKKKSNISDILNQMSSDSDEEQQHIARVEDIPLENIEDSDK